MGAACCAPTQMAKYFFIFSRLIAQTTLYLAERIVEVPEVLAHWMIASFKKSEYVRCGACIKCGQCCQAIGMQFPRGWLKRPWLVQLIKKWHFLRYNFRFVELQDNMLVYECLYQNSNQTCGIHRLRPALCRDFPRALLFGHPKLHEGCGFFFVKRNAERFEEVLEKIISSSQPQTNNHSVG